MAEVKPPSVRSVRAALRKSGLPEAQTQGRTRLTKHATSTGWHVWEVAGEVRVACWSPVTLSATARDAALGRYWRPLRAAGWKVIEDERSGFLAVLAAQEENGNG